MEKLRSLLDTLQAAIDRAEDGGGLRPGPGPASGAGSALVDLQPSLRALLRPIVQDLREHQARLEAEDRLRATEMVRIARLSRFQAAELEALMESLPDGVLIGTRDGLTGCNATALRMLGVPALEAIRAPGDRIRCLGLRWPDGRPLAAAELPFELALAGQSGITECLATRPDTGAELHLRSAAAPILDGGAVAGAVVICSDITERRREAERLRLACDQADEAQRRCAALNAHLDQLVQARTRELTQANAALAKALAEVERLKERLEAENAYLHVENDRRWNFGEVIGRSPAIREVFYRIESVAPTDTTVLLLGETGTGKSMMARAIHARSARRDRPLVMVNCSALPANLIESELFGRERGAFTGANATQIGRFELADKGSIFLDEVGDLPLELQAKLLHVIQEKEFSRLGSPHTIKVNVRIIAATNRDLKEEMAAGRFREDLYYRLNIFPVVVPPLRQRKEDIPLLVEFFLAKLGRGMGKEIRTVSAATLQRLAEHAWPGNVRELENVIERALITSRGDTLQVLDRFEPAPEPGPDPAGGPLATLAQVERAHILKALRQTRGRIDGRRGAAELLGLNPSTLRGRMRKEGIQRYEWYGRAGD
jgi:transcriptional regulator with PAS, ATPase and Fis domain